MAKEACWSCKFYNSTSRGVGKCRRMPPPWLFVDSGDWCGEYKPKKENESEMEGIRQWDYKKEACIDGN
jgi:hypothetical protein